MNLDEPARRRHPERDSFAGSPTCCHSVEHAVARQQHTRAAAAVRAIREGVQRSHLAGLRHPENSARIARAARARCPVEVAVGDLDQRAGRTSRFVRLVECVQHRERAVERHAERDAAIEKAALLRGAVQTPQVGRYDQVESVLMYMRDDDAQLAVPFDVAMLAKRWEGIVRDPWSLRVTPSEAAERG